MRKTFISKLCKLARQDDRICLIIGDLGFLVVEPFAKEFPDRFLNAGIAEQNMIGMATGWSLSENKVVFVYSIANFPTLRCLEQIRNDVCYHKANVKIVSVGAGLTYGSAGFSHHAIEDLAVMRALPGMVVSAPADAYETARIVQLSVDTAGPFFIRMEKNNEPNIHRSPCTFEIGEPIIFRKEGDILLVSTGTLLSEVIKAATLLEKKKMKVAVVGIPFLKPFGEERFKKILLNKRAVFTIEEHNKFGGLGSVISEIIADNNLNVPLHRIYLPEFTNHVGSQHDLRKFYKIDKEGIVSKALNFMNQI
ncbi:MAG: transketolase [Candidatus Scalindua sp.]|jgi:transketolase|nr:transketolase [Candidatus Scalindua sp.]